MSRIGTVWGRLDSIRLKVTDRCPWNCWWCHNEGTGERNPRLVGDVQWEKTTETAIRLLTEELELDEVHLTGGEPTAHPQLPKVVKGLCGLGLTVKATTIGCNEAILRNLVASGLQGLNFSLHALDASLLHSTQIDRGIKWIERQMAQELNAIGLARELGIEVKLNTVLADQSDFPRVIEVVRWAQSLNIPMRIMNELSSGDTAYQAVAQLMDQLGGLKLYTMYIAGSSSFSTYYHLPSGYIIAFKQIRANYLDQTMCARCSLKSTGVCSEGFYGIRLEKRRLGDEWRMFVRLCIHRIDAATLLPVEEFLRSDQLAEIKEKIATFVWGQHAIPCPN